MNIAINNINKIINNISNQYFDDLRTLKFLTNIIDLKNNFKPIAKNKFKQIIYYPLGSHVNNLQSVIRKSYLKINK